jgi:integrase
MQRAKLTNGAVEKFRCREGKEQDTLWCGETRGFCMRLSAKTGTRTYVLVYRVKGSRQERYITIGRHNDPWKVDQARAKALEIKSQMLAGVDPVEEAERHRVEAAAREAQERAHATTLRQVLESYLTSRTLRPSTAKDYRYHCDKNLATWLDEPVRDVTRDKCLAKFVELSNRAPGQANLTMTYLRALLNHARIMHEDADGNPTILLSNPVSRMIKLKGGKLNPEQPRKTRIPLDKIGACWLWLCRRAENARTENERTAANWLMFILLTGTRRNEAGSLRWQDTDMERKVFKLRGEVTKNHRDLELPMSDAMHELLTAQRQPFAHSKAIKRRRVQRSSEYVFATNGRKTPYITNAQSTIEGLTEVAGAHVHVHALRRTFESIGMHLGIDSDIRRMLLNHVGSSTDVHARHYANDRSTLKGAVQKIAAHIVNESKVAEAMENGSNVVPITKRV